MRKSKRIVLIGVGLLAVGLLAVSRSSKGASPRSAKAFAAATPTTHPAPLRVADTAGNPHLLQDDPRVKATGLVFLSTQCPISNKYVPELNRMASGLPVGARLLGVISDPTVTRAAAVAFVAEYKIAFPVLFDASGQLARRLQPDMTPEAFVLDGGGGVKYRGRIDDLWVDLKKQRNEPQTHELQDALGAVAAGRPVSISKTEAVGCFFEAWTEGSIPAKVTYTRDVAPILNANCVQCHRPGEVAPFSLLTYTDAASHAKQLAKVTDRRLMPPWKAEPGFGHFTDERRLTDTEIAILTAWATTGALEGDAADLPPTPHFTDGWALGEPDMIVTMPEKFTIPAAGRDIYRAFVMPMNLPEDRYVVGFEFKPGATSVLHHALFFLDDHGAARKLAAASKDGLPGYKSGGGPGFRPSGGMGGWAPGATPFILPDGIGRPVHKGADLIFQVHYHPDGKEHTDQSKVAIYFTKKPIQKQAISWPLMNNQINIPAGDAHYVRTASITAPFDVTLFGVTPHMHLIGKQMKVVATKPSGEVVPLVWIKDWDFRWQDQYQYVNPVKLPKGTVVSMEALYDNSTSNADNPANPPQRVHRGEQTTDEMCICFLQMTIDSQNGVTAGSGKAGLYERLFGARTTQK